MIGRAPRTLDLTVEADSVRLARCLIQYKGCYRQLWYSGLGYGPAPGADGATSGLPVIRYQRSVQESERPVCEAWFI